MVNVKVFKTVGGLGKTLGKRGHLCWVLKNKEELAKSGRAPQAEGLAQAKVWRCEHMWPIQEPSIVCWGKAASLEGKVGFRL